MSADANVYKDDQDNTYVLTDSGDMVITVSDGTQSGTITLNWFDKDTNNFGLTLEDPNPEKPSTTFTATSTDDDSYNVMHSNRNGWEEQTYLANGTAGNDHLIGGDNIYMRPWYDGWVDFYNNLSQEEKARKGRDDVYSATELLDSPILAYGARDVLAGWAGDDLIEGKNGENYLVGGLGNDHILGGNSVDYIWGNHHMVYLPENDTDLLTGLNTISAIAETGQGMTI